MISGTLDLFIYFTYLLFDRWSSFVTRTTRRFGFRTGRWWRCRQFTPELLGRDGDDMLAGGGDLAQSLLLDSFDLQLSGAELSEGRWMSGTDDP